MRASTVSKTPITKQEFHYAYLETLANTDSLDHGLKLAVLLERGTVHELPMVKDSLREGLALGRATEIRVETEGLHDRQVRLDREHGGSGTLLLGEDLATTPVEHRVDTTNGVLRALDLDKVDRLLETGGGEQARSVGNTTASGDKLSSTTVDGVGMELQIKVSERFNQTHTDMIAYRNIHNVYSNTTHVLLSADTLLRRPLERSDTRVLDFVKVLHTLGDIDQQIRAGSVRAETPDLAGIGNIPTVLVGENTSASLEIVTGVDLAILDRLAEFILKRYRLSV